MHRHEYFDLWLHDDGDLGPLVQGEVVERVTLHEWPLSSVQRLTLSDGRELIYKTQFGPTIESEFYARARSDLLPWARTIAEFDGHVCMLVEFIRGSLIETLDLPEDEAARIGREVLARVADISGELPHLYDVSDEKKWEAFIRAMLRTLTELVEQGRFSLVNEAMVDDLERWAFSESVLATIRGGAGCVHRDLTEDNLFVMPDGYRLIDWQRPILGPPGVDMASLMASLGFDPVRHAGEGAVRVWRLLNINWLAQCATRWFPAGAPTYDKQIAELATRLDDLATR